MNKILGIGFVLVAALLFVPSEAGACKTCDVPAFWDPNCANPGCTYCVACATCCGGDPEAGGNCQLYCEGPAITKLDLSQLFLNPANLSSEASATPAACSSTSR